MFMLEMLHFAAWKRVDDESCNYEAGMDESQGDLLLCEKDLRFQPECLFIHPLAYKIIIVQRG